MVKSSMSIVKITLQYCTRNVCLNKVYCITCVCDWLQGPMGLRGDAGKPGDVGLPGYSVRKHFLK